MIQNIDLIREQVVIFTRPVEGSVYRLADNSYGMRRIEIRSVTSDIHLGHVFPDGPNGLPRYCINATVLEFLTRDEYNKIKNKGEGMKGKK